jgi:hypothetical protein
MKVRNKNLNSKCLNSAPKKKGEEIKIHIFFLNSPPKKKKKEEEI